MDIFGGTLATSRFKFFFYEGNALHCSIVQRGCVYMFPNHSRIYEYLYVPCSDRAQIEVGSREGLFANYTWGGKN